MADQAIGNPFGIPGTSTGDADSPSNLSGSGDPQTHSLANLGSLSVMRSRLAAIDAGYYTAARLNQMSYNDMVYAIRVNDHSSTIKQ